MKKGFDVQYGARPLRRAITKLVEDQLSEEILKGTVKTGSKVQIDVIEDKLNFKTI
jgi:ATP-dependent Clp protease ATP-binding subunit ClpC